MTKLGGALSRDPEGTEAHGHGGLPVGGLALGDRKRAKLQFETKFQLRPEMRVTFLGTGTSRGIPVIGCRCRTCSSDNPRNKRLRTSVLLQSEVSVVIDTSVDFRTQMLREAVESLDAVVFTHSHVDHILGLDDVYPFNIWSKISIPIYGDSTTLGEIKKTFRHLFQAPTYPGIPRVELRPIEGDFQVGDLHFVPIELLHGRLPIYGYRIGTFAYLTDVSEIPPPSFQKLKGVESLVLDALRHRPHPTHFSIQEAIDAAETIGAVETYLVHMSHEVEHEETNRQLPAGIRLAYDGLVLEIDG